MALRLRDAGKLGDDLESAVEELEAAYGVRVKYGLNSDLGATCLELGIVYSERRKGAAAGNAEKSILYLKKASEYYDAKWTPRQYALLNRTLSAVNLRRDGTRAAQLDGAIDALQKALDAAGRAGAPDDVAEIAKSLEILKSERLRSTAAP